MIFLFTTKTAQLAELFFWMFGSFFIGYLYAWIYFKKKYKAELNESQETISQLKSEMQCTIRARKTVERGGIEIKHPKQLNFENIGKASEESKDDLTQINGIGNFIQKKLNSIGIFTYEQISKFNKEDIVTVTDLIQFFPGRIIRDNWTGQAKQLLNKGD